MCLSVLRHLWSGSTGISAIYQTAIIGAISEDDPRSAKDRTISVYVHVKRSIFIDLSLISEKPKFPEFV